MQEGMHTTGWSSSATTTKWGRGWGRGGAMHDDFGLDRVWVGEI